MCTLSSLSKSATSTALDISEVGLLIFGLLLVAGLIGEYAKSERWKKHVRVFEMFVIIGVAGELLADGGIFLFSRHLQVIADQEIADLTKEAGDAKTSAERASSAAYSAKASADDASTAAGSALDKSKAAEAASEHALALAQSTEKYAAWRTITDEQERKIKKHLAPLKGHTLEMFVFTTEPETFGYAERLGTVLGKVMNAHLSSYPGKLIPPPGLSFTVGKDREKDFALIVEALDIAGVEKASALRKTAEHRAPDDGIEVNIGGKH
jgi:hypothetical protein